MRLELAVIIGLLSIALLHVSNRKPVENDCPTLSEWHEQAQRDCQEPTEACQRLMRIGLDCAGRFEAEQPKGPQKPKDSTMTMTDEEIKQTVNHVRRLLQSLTPHTSDAMKVCLLTGRAFGVGVYAGDRWRAAWRD